MKIKNVDFLNVPNKLGTAIGNKIVQAISDGVSREEFINSQDFYKLISAIDIDWNGAVIDENTVINDTADLVIIIKNLLEEINNLKSKVLELENNDKNIIDSTYSSNQNGEITIINPNSPSDIVA